MPNRRFLAARRSRRTALTPAEKLQNSLHSNQPPGVAGVQYSMRQQTGAQQRRQALHIRTRQILQLFLAAAALFLALGCANTSDTSDDYFNFSQIDGYEAIRAQIAATPPPTEEEKALLQKYRPALYRAADNEEGPLDFYGDYISHGTLVTGSGEHIQNPTPAQLNRHKHDPAAVFSHQPPPNPQARPVAYGGVSRETLHLPDIGAITLTFLSYHFAHRHSGLPDGISPIAKFLADIVADSRDWHQLDHYTALFLALEDEQPRAVILQQHNNMRTYFVGDQHFPNAAPLKIDAALHSNELYPHSPQRREWRSVGFLTPDSVHYLLELTDDGGIRSGLDVTHGQQQVPYRLEILPPDDAFYVFEGWLGEHRRLPGRDGPPGAAYRTLPQIWSLHLSLPVFYWNEGDADYAAILAAETDHWRLSEAAIAKFKQRFSAEWQKRFPKN